MLKIINVSKRFGDIVALQDISFSVKGGEFVFITGPSGAGKTTLFNLIISKYLPDTGKIFLKDLEITALKRKDIPLLRQRIGYVFQDFKVLPERTVRENIEVALAVKGVETNLWKEKVDKVLSITGLEKRSDLFPSQLSGGELQRVSIARALVMDPLLFLADEPTGNLDWQTADQIMEILLKINEEGKTILMATHHRLIVEKYKKRVITLEGGRIVSDSGEKDLSHKEKKVKIQTEVEEK